MIKRRILLAVPLATPALAQPALPRIGWLTIQREASLAPFIPALRAGLVEAGRAVDLLIE